MNELYIYAENGVDPPKWNMFSSTLFICLVGYFLYFMVNDELYAEYMNNLKRIVLFLICWFYMAMSKIIILGSILEQKFYQE